METKTALFCLGPAAKGALEVRQVPRRKPARRRSRDCDVQGASVNPIDVRRAEGYGARLLSLLGAGKFPMVLGNDFAGTVATTGAKVSVLKRGERVYGLKPTSADGTHASHVLVKAAYVLRAPAGGDLQALAALPYSFVTMWLAVRGAGLTRENAAGKKVLVHGAAGGLGTLALQMLSAWGAKITAIARPPTLAGCLQAGAAEVVDGSKAAIQPPSVACSMRRSISPPGTTTLRSSAACGTVRSAMPRPCIHCWAISTGMAGCAVR